MCDGSITSMLPAITIGQFGMQRGTQVYAYMYSTFGVAAMIGFGCVSLGLRELIGYRGMFALGFTSCTIAAILTYVLNEKKPFNYIARYQYQKSE